MKPNLLRHAYKIPTFWAAPPLTRTIERREQYWSSLYVGKEYIGIEWGDSGISMNGKLYDIS